jgi:hypothetical protein
MASTWRRLAAAAAAAALAAGCESSTSSGTGRLRVLLTDSPIEGVESATFHISQVYLVGGSDASGPRYTITSTPVDYDLLELQDGITAQLGDVSIPVGMYTQLRFVVDEATITLKAPLTFSDHSTSKTLTVPSGMQTGIKVDLGGGLQITPGQTILVAEIDVSRNFVFTGPPTAPTGALFTPVIRATVQNVAGSISGTVGESYRTNGKVYAIDPNNTPPADTVTTAVPDATTGTYSLQFLPPGTYDVLLGTLSNGVLTAVTTKTGVVVNAGQDTQNINLP